MGCLNEFLQAATLGAGKVVCVDSGLLLLLQLVALCTEQGVLVLPRSGLFGGFSRDFERLDRLLRADEGTLVAFGTLLGFFAVVGLFVFLLHDLVNAKSTRAAEALRFLGVCFVLRRIWVLNRHVGQNYALFCFVEIQLPLQLVQLRLQLAFLLVRSLGRLRNHHDAELDCVFRHLLLPLDRRHRVLVLLLVALNCTGLYQGALPLEGLQPARGRDPVVAVAGRHPGFPLGRDYWCIGRIDDKLGLGSSSRRCLVVLVESERLFLGLKDRQRVLVESADSFQLLLIKFKSFFFHQCARCLSLLVGFRDLQIVALALWPAAAQSAVMRALL